MSRKKKDESSLNPGHSVTTISQPAWSRWVVTGLFASAGILALCAAGQTAVRESSISEIGAQGWGSYAGVIVDNKIRALWHAACMAALSAGALWFFLSNARARSAQKIRLPESQIWSPASLVAWILMLIVAGDVWLLSRHYVQAMPMSAVAEIL